MPPERDSQGVWKDRHLVLNAGIMGLKSLREVVEKDFDDHFLINVKGPFFLVQAAEPHLKEGEETDISLPEVLSFDLG